MKIVSIVRKDEEKTIDYEWGKIIVFFESDNISMCYGIIRGKTPLHMHKKSHEYYYIIKGSSQITLGAKTHNVKPGDAISIPVETFHAIEKKSEELEMCIITCPKYDPSDNYEK